MSKRVDQNGRGMHPYKIKNTERNNQGTLPRGQQNGVTCEGLEPTLVRKTAAYFLTRAEMRKKKKRWFKSVSIRLKGETIAKQISGRLTKKIVNQNSKTYKGITLARVQRHAKRMPRQHQDYYTAQYTE